MFPFSLYTHFNVADMLLGCVCVCGGGGGGGGGPELDTSNKKNVRCVFYN